jgi:deoxyribodipyrimidine photo-lyase
MTSALTLVWLRDDLRLTDNPALRAGVDGAERCLLLYVLDEALPERWRMGGAQRWWLHHSLTALAHDVEKFGGRLILRRGDPRAIVPGVAEAAGADRVVWNRRYLSFQKEAGEDVTEALRAQGTDTESFAGTLLYEPGEIATGSGTPYKVFSPYYRALKAKGEPREPLPKVTKIAAPADAPPSDDVADWGLLPTRPNWADGFEPVWTPGERGALKRLSDWLGANAARYQDERNRADLDTTSRLSPHLHFGEVSPNAVWHAVRSRTAKGEIPEDQADGFLSEVAWRDFSYQVLAAYPDMLEKPYDRRFERFEYDGDREKLSAWQRGRTGYPIVDAGMRQLWQTGFMHNRVRMIVASFLVKDLLINPNEGIDWFWDTLVCADAANNTASWQWVAGTGVDASPYFRVFNPVGQGEKFDPQGDYVKRWVPELEGLPKKHVHRPWEAPKAVLQKAGVRLGEDYPLPIVDHSEQRDEALRRYRAVKAA